MIRDFEREAQIILKFAQDSIDVNKEDENKKRLEEIEKELGSAEEPKKKKKSKN